MSPKKYESKAVTEPLCYRMTKRLAAWLKMMAMLMLLLAATAGPGARSALATVEPDGTLDLPFDAGSFTNGEVRSSVLQSDGKVLISGTFDKVHGVKIGRAHV